MYNSVSHDHLRKLIDCDDDPFSNPLFFKELAYSTFIVPTFPVDDNRAMFLHDKRYVPILSDFYEYDKAYGMRDDLNPMISDFDHILSCGVDMLFNPSSENLVIDVDYFKGKSETPLFPYSSRYVGYNRSELNLIAKRIRNPRLKEFIGTPGCVYYESFFEELARSTLMTLVYPENQTGDVACLRGKPTPLKITEDGFLEVFTSCEEIKRSPDSYVQIVNLPEFMEFVIRHDHGGMVINSDTDCLILDRETILMNFGDFRGRYDFKRFVQSHNYAFKLEALIE